MNPLPNWYPTGLEGRVGFPTVEEFQPPQQRTGGQLFKPVRLLLPQDIDKHELGRRCQQITLLLLIDESGSMYADHAGIRNAASRSLVDLLRRAGGGSVGVVRWNHGIEEPVQELLDVQAHWRQLDEVLQDSIASGGNDLPIALRRAKAMLPKPKTDEYQVVAVLTDGIEPVTADHIDAVHDLPTDSVHMLLIDHQNGCGPDLEAAWRALPLGSFTRLSLTDPNRLTWQVADALLRPHGINVPPVRRRTNRMRRLFR